VADLLAAGAGKAVGDVTDLAQALGQAGLVANGAGQSIEDTTGVLAAFADAGLLGSDAGTSLKAALIALQAPTDKARGIMEQYSLSFYDTNGQMLSFDEIAGQLKGNLSDLTDEQRNAALAQIFGNDALRVANVLYDEGAEGIQKYIDQTNDSGYAAKVAADRLNNLTGDVEKLGGAIDTALIKSGSGVNDRLRGMVQVATGVVDALGSIPEPILGLGTQIGGIAAAIAVAGGAALIAVPKVVQFRTALATLNISAGSVARGVGVASTALAVAGTAFAVWAQRQAEATATTAEFLESLDESTGAVTNYTRELVAKKLAEAGAFDGARDAGISQRELTDAIINGGAELEGLRQKMYDFANANPFSLTIANAVNTTNDLSDGLERSEKNFDDQAAAAGDSADKTTAAADSYQDAATKAEELESNLRKLIDAVNELNGLGQDAVSANAAYRDALAGVSEEVQRQKDDFLEPQRKAYEELNGSLDGFVGDLTGFTLSLDETTDAGSANAAMLADLAGKAQAAADAQLEVDSKTIGAEAATSKYLDTLAQQRQAFIDSATQAGFNADEVQKLADRVFAMPDKKEVEVIAKTAQANADLDYLARKREAEIAVRLKTYVAGAGDAVKQGLLGNLTFADGGEVPGRPSHKDNMLAMVASGEFVVRTAVAQRHLDELNYLNTYGRLPGYANGGEVQPRYAPPTWAMPAGGGTRTVNQTTNVYPQPGMSEYQIGRAAAESAVFWMGTGE
jgi:hypothetical protein